MTLEQRGDELWAEFDDPMVRPCRDAALSAPARMHGRGQSPVA
jgi:hypothetical protein